MSWVFRAQDATAGAAALVGLDFLGQRVGVALAVERDRLHGCRQLMDLLGFLLIVHATGRDDLLKDAEAENLEPLFKKWLQWMDDNNVYLRASRTTWTWDIDVAKR